jgi:hypothetical protein
MRIGERRDSLDRRFIPERISSTSQLRLQSHFKVLIPSAVCRGRRPATLLPLDISALVAYKDV